MKSRLLFVLAFGVGSVTPTPTHAADLAGLWNGTWTKENDALPVTVTFAKGSGGYSGSFDSDALQVAGIPLSSVTEAGGNIHFELKGDQSTAVFDGKASADRLAGEFTDGPSKGQFELDRAPTGSAAIRVREVTFVDRDVTLAGSLLLPAASGKSAAIIFLQGSGPEGRWANRYLAQKFAEHGIVALIFDKRGVGGSTGDWRRVGFEPLVDDAAAGIRFLQAQSEVDPGRIGIYGHSQGGTIAPWVAIKAKSVAFIIASAAGGLTPAEVETYSVENSIGVKSLPTAEQADARAFVRAIVDVAYRGKDHASLRAVAQRFKDRSWYFDPPPPDNSYWALSRQIAGYQPARYWRHVTAPVLLIYGLRDERVPPKASADAIVAALKRGGNGKVTVKTYPDADHTLTIVNPPRTGGWPKHEPDYAATLASWTSTRLE